MAKTKTFAPNQKTNSLSVYLFPDNKRRWYLALVTSLQKWVRWECVVIAPTKWKTHTLSRKSKVWRIALSLSLPLYGSIDYAECTLFAKVTINRYSVP